MVNLFGRKFTREDLLKRFGTLSQLTFARPFEFIDGREKGVRAVEVKTGSGLSFLVIIDRGLDIGMAEYKGVPISYISPTLYVHPAYFEPEKFGWLRGAFLGLLTTCGLTYAGHPSVDLGEELGLHGRYSYIPASNVTIDYEWINDECDIVVKGVVREVSFFGPNIALYREIRAGLGDKKIVIKDRVVNEGYEEQPFMIIYHFNFGFPIVDDGSRIILSSQLYVPRDEEARKDAEKFDELHGPIAGYKEKVYFHDMATDSEGYAYAGIVNENLLNGLGVYIKFRKSELHRFVQWKMLGEQFYVVGLEPANCLVLGRAKEREWGTLQFLKPGEERRFTLEVGVLEEKEIEEFKEKVNEITRGKKPRMVETVDEFIKLTKH